LCAVCPRKSKNLKIASKTVSSCRTPAKPPPGTLGQGFLDIHLNPTTHWKDLPEETWKSTLGGYQVLKKWLSYREQSILHRPLTQEEAEQFTHHTRRITALLAETCELDRHYESVLPNNQPRQNPDGKTLL